jgi:ABC-type proline/glycine betaine transport system ATPase subunit
MTEREVNYTISEVDQFDLTIDPRLFSCIQSGSGAGTTTTAITTLLVGDNCHPVPPSIETQRT